MRISHAIFFLLISSIGLAQKIKYKDVFTLLSTRQYEQAEPFLKKYIAENDDNPNAFLFMGIIYQEKTAKDDILKRTDDALAHMDSAIYFLEKAHKGIDDKELKKNKDYYVMYNRRDLRTGQFGVKLSDVHFDIESRRDNLKERIVKVKMVKHYFSQAENLYKQSNALYVAIHNSVPGLRELYLQSDENTIKQLTQLSVKFDSSAKAFEFYKSSISNLEKAGYSQSWNLTAIENFNRDGVELTDFYGSELKIWDYKRFSTEALKVMTTDIQSLRANLVRYDVEINKLRERLVTDSVSVKNDLTKLVDNLLGEKIRQFDPDPLPMDVLSLKVAEVEYQSTIVEGKKFRDSDDVFVKLAHTRNEMQHLLKVDSLASKLLSRNIDAEAANYMHFVTNTYHSVDLLKGFAKTMKDLAAREKIAKSEELARRNAAVDWLVTGNDSIPLKIDMASSYKPLVVKENKYTAGVAVADTVIAKGYFCTITPSRKPDVNVNFPVDSHHFSVQALPFIHGLATSDASNSIYFVALYSEKRQDNKVPVTISKIYRSDGLSWSHNFMLDFVPNELLFTPDTGEIQVKSGDGVAAIIDKAGKIR